MSVSKLYERSMKMLQMVIHEDANIENKESEIKQVEEYSLPQNVQSLDAEQTLNIEKSPDTIFISNNNEVGEIQQYVEENSWPLNEVHNRSVEQAINMESCTYDRFVASQHEPANEASNLALYEVFVSLGGELIEILGGGEDKENNILINR
ncbi:unnamed protein product [Parnassius apollo]|uniref:(apollo) hypothetical protein n=1 Tax=Parnassius apollo TaxID=110799 RepID=A0A8S3X2A5_PARAO|nr:unnamed protein product [Parnassius apollo]